MADVSFNGLAIVLAVAFTVPLLLGLAPRLRLPSVVLEIIVGIVIGPFGLGWVEVDALIQTLSQVGLAFLLFLAGLEIELDYLKDRLLRVTGLGFLLSLGLALLVSHGLQAAGFSETPLFVAIILAASGLGVIIPVLKDVDEISSDFGQLVIVGATIAEFGTIILLSLLFSAHTTAASTTLLLLGGVVLLAVVLAITISGAEHWKRLSATLLRLQDTTAMIRIRGAFFLLVVFTALVEDLGLEIILGAFIAGVLLGFIDQDKMRTHTQFRLELQAVGFGVFIPIFFIASGLRFNLGALLESESSLTRVPLFLAALLLVRGVPALLYRPLMGSRRAVAAGLLQATTLSFVVAASQMGVELGKISEVTAAALVAAGLLSVLIFPAGALALLREKGWLSG